MGKGNFETSIKNILVNEPMSRHTTLGVGGPAKYFVDVSNEQQLVEVIQKANADGVKYLLIGGGSNLLVSDDGYNGLVVLNSIKEISFNDNVVYVSSGQNLWDFINLLIDKGLGGMETMSGIPGSVGGAVYGNAGAYGQTISDFLTRVKAFTGKEIVWLDNNECQFGYRTSAFKSNNYVILGAEFKFQHVNSGELRIKAEEILSQRLKKYPVGIKCPGSFFKNLIAANFPPDILNIIPPDKIVYGKIPAGYLLEEVGAKGDKLNNIGIADYHGNLIMNLGNGTASDFMKLANKYSQKVYERFKVKLEPEVQLIGF